MALEERERVSFSHEKIDGREQCLYTCFRCTSYSIKPFYYVDIMYRNACRWQLSRESSMQQLTLKNAITEEPQLLNFNNIRTENSKTLITLNSIDKKEFINGVFLNDLETWIPRHSPIVI